MSATIEYKYTARNRTGESVAGSVSAKSVPEAARQLREQWLLPIRIEESGKALAALRGRGGSRVPARKLAKFYSQLADLLKSGVPLLRALELLAKQSTNKNLANVVDDIRRRVADGESIADSMAFHRRTFGDLSVSMARAGQEAGFLEDVFKRIAKFTDRQEDLKGRVMGALAYPLVLGGIGAIIVSVLVIFFVPSFARIFDRLRDRGELPAATEALLLFSETLQSYGLVVLGLIVAAVMLLRRQAETPAGRRVVDTIKLRMPVGGRVFRDLAITRFNRVLGTLRRNGVPLLNALRIAKDSAGNVLLTEAIEKAAESVKAGERLATPLRESGVFPAEIVEMIAIAEESNSLEDVLLESADSLEDQTTRQLDLAVRFLEPLMLLVMAAITLMVVVALLLPIFKMSSGV